MFEKGLNLDCTDSYESRLGFCLGPQAFLKQQQKAIEAEILNLFACIV